MTTQLKDVATSVVALVPPDTTALVLAQLMRQHDTRIMLVMDAQQDDRPLGFVTDHDLVFELLAVGLDPNVFTAGDLMTQALGQASPEMDVREALTLMHRHRWRAVVIADEVARPVGIVTMEDLSSRAFAVTRRAAA